MKYTKREQRAIAEKFAPKYIKKEDVKIGFRFYLRADDCGGKLWFEVVDFEYDWRFHEDMPVVWNELHENFELWPLSQIVAADTSTNERKRDMRYTVNYFGAFFTDDNDKYNTYETNRFEDAVDMLKTLVSCGFEDAYLKDEEYQCSMHWDKREQEYYWAG